MKFLQIIIILCGLVGSAMGLDIMFRLPERGAGGGSGDFEITRPCLDENGEPTC